MRESDLHQPVFDWLEQRGLEVHAEVPMGMGFVDLVGIQKNPAMLVSVELKLAFTKTLRRQLARTVAYSDESWACVTTTPNKENLGWCQKLGFGVLKFVEGRVITLVEPKIWDSKAYNRARLFEVLARKAHKGIVAGKPCRKGVGPAHDVHKRVKSYIQEHQPKSWTDVFENVPNHYANPNSLRGVMNGRFGVSLIDSL